MSSFVENLSILTLFLSVEGFENFSAKNFTNITYLEVEHDWYIQGASNLGMSFCLILKHTRKEMTSGILHIKIVRRTTGLKGCNFLAGFLQVSDILKHL